MPSYQRPAQSFFLVFLHFFLLLSARVNALPLRARQDTSSSSTSVTTTHSTETAAGTLTESCVIVLTPQKDSNGNDVVQKVTTCTVKMVPLNNDGSKTGSSTTVATTETSSPTSVPSSSPLSSLPAVTTMLSNSQPSSSASSTPETRSSTSPTISSSTTSVQTSPPVSQVISVNGLSTVAVTSAATPVPSSPSPTTQIPPISTSLTPDATPSGSSASASAAAAEQASATASATAAFTLPGKKLSVLPIGLGVFAGISVIALIVVGLVTYERTKYRKQFRERKFAESRAMMGYGGSYNA